jgi:6-phosphogluconolactonase/glucosamine-6-phosphate isomerase/deaminase
MKYVHTTNTDPVIDYLATTISSHLASGEKVLWILSGGSGGKVCAEVSKRLTVPLDNLITTLSDERYVPLNDPDENWKQLVDYGFSVPGALTYRPIHGKDRTTTAHELGEFIEKAYQDADYKIGLFGIGADGHTAGIKPGTTAVEADGWATGFTGNDFERITMTFNAIKQLDEIVVQAMGTDKAPVLKQLLNEDIDSKIQPAQVLKSVKTSTLFTDYEGENA